MRQRELHAIGGLRPKCCNPHGTLPRVLWVDGAERAWNWSSHARTCGIKFSISESIPESPQHLATIARAKCIAEGIELLEYNN